MTYDIGMTVYNTSQRLGWLVRLIFTPRSHHMTHFVIRDPQHDAQKIVALNLVYFTTRATIVLHYHVTWDGLPDYQADYYQAISQDSPHRVVPKSNLHPLYYYAPIRKGNTPTNPYIGATVYDTNDQQCGQVISSQTNNGHLETLTMRRPQAHHTTIDIPLAWISHTEENDIYLSVKCQTFKVS